MKYITYTTYFLALEPQKVIREANSKGLAYHSLHFPDGTLLKGIYDMSKYLKYYNLPEDVFGQSVLDIGCATGFFSFEFAKRRASKVVGLDKNIGDVQFASNILMGTNVEFLRGNFNNDIRLPKFDIVLCSNLLQHVSDIFGTIQHIRLVTREKAIICADVMDDPAMENKPMAFFYGTRQKELGESVRSFWQPNLECLRKMLFFAQFKKVETISTFILESEDSQIKVRNAVMHAYV